MPIKQERSGKLQIDVRRLIQLRTHKFRDAPSCGRLTETMSIEIDYFDPNDILADEQRVKIRFKMNVPWSPLLYCEEPSTSMIEKGTVLEVPFWLAETLSSSHIATILPLRAFSARTLCDLEAGAENLCLKDLSPYFYRLGQRCSQIMPLENYCQLLKKCLVSRLEFLARPITMPSESKYVGGLTTTADPHRAIFHTSNQTFASRLDHDEENLHKTAIEWRKRTDRWAERQSHRLSKMDIYAERKIGQSFI